MKSKRSGHCYLLIFCVLVAKVCVFHGILPQTEAFVAPYRLRRQHLQRSAPSLISSSQPNTKVVASNHGGRLFSQVQSMSMMPASSLGGQALVYMFLLALQFGIQPTLTRRFTPKGICRSTVILMQELLKLLLSFSMLALTGTTKAAFSGWKVTTWMAVAFLPAGLYAVQNIAALKAYQNLDSLTFNVLNQTKTLSAALCCYLVLGYKQSPTQVFSLLLLLLSALVMERIVPMGTFFSSNNSNKINEWDSHHWIHGVLPIMVASFISGLAGALCQKSLQSQGGGRNPYLFSMELCAASTLILTASLFFSPDGKNIAEEGFWNGWTAKTWIPILTNSIGGIIVGLVTKYAGSVQKGFALIFGIFISGIVQAVLQPDVGVSKQQALGGALASLSMWLHLTNPPILAK